MIELIHTKSCLVFGCGNPLFGDDGFGVEVIAHLQKRGRLPSHAACLEVGTAIRDFLFDILLAAKKPETKKRRLNEAIRLLAGNEKLGMK